MPRYTELVDGLAHAVDAGELAPGAHLPSVRELARREGTTVATVSRAFAELARAGVISSVPRRRARVAASGPARARRLLAGAGAGALALAGSDDPLLDVVLAAVPDDVERRGARGSFGGLTALWDRSADAATLHLSHRDGEHNAPHAARVLAGRRPLLVRLWRREQVIVVPRGNPLGVGGVADLERLTVARRAPGTGTSALVDRLLRMRGRNPGATRGPVAGSHLEVALAVAAGVADAGVAVRAAATVAGLDAVPLVWEPFDLALPADALEAAAPLLDRLGAAEVGRRSAELGGYDLTDAGRVRVLA